MANNTSLFILPFYTWGTTNHGACNGFQSQESQFVKIGENI